MTDYAISCCSTSDLTRDHFESRQVAWVPFHYELNGVERTDDLWQSISAEEFYATMAAGAETKTSQTNVQEFKDHFARLLTTHTNIVHITLSSGISGVIQSAEIAANEIMDEHPGCTVRIIDSLGASSGYGLLVDKLADLRDQGMGFDDLCQWAEENRLNVHHWFYSTDLTFYVKGGRVSKAAGFFGTALRICPLLNVDHAGKLVPREKIRTKRRACQAAFERMITYAQDGEDYNGKVFISQSAMYDDARALADMIEARFPRLDGPVQIYDIGTTIGSHTGPGTVALFFWGVKRTH